MRKRVSWIAIGGSALCLAAVLLIGTLTEEVPASPVDPVPDRDVYYPGTEALSPDEMRVVALGTGMPTIRPKQAAACFLVELGNGDKFLFDIGYGSVERLAAMKIPMDYLDKVFIGHLHMDHFGDLDALWIGALESHGSAQRGQIDQARHAGEVLKDDARRPEGNLRFAGCVRAPLRKLLDVFDVDREVIQRPKSCL